MPTPQQDRASDHERQPILPPSGYRTDRGTHESKETWRIDEAIDHIGWGKAHYKALFQCGLLWAGDSMEMMLLAFIMPDLKQEWGLEGWQSSFIGMMTFAGMFFGSMSFGIVSDRYGRRMGYIGSVSLVAAFGLTSGFTPMGKAVGFPFMLFCRFWVGFGMGGAGVAFTLFSEVVPSSVRGLGLVIVQGLFWSVSACFSTGIGWLIIPHYGWRPFLIASSLPCITLLLLFPWLIESPIWLHKHGREEEALAILQKMADDNDRSLPPGKLAPPVVTAENKRGMQRIFGMPRWLSDADKHHLQTEETEAAVSPNPSAVKPWQIGGLVIEDPLTLRLTLQLMVIWVVNVFVYYGIVFITPVYFKGPGSDESSMYIDALITTSAELPGIVIAAGGIDKLGRRNMQALLFIVCSVSTAAVLLGRDTQPHCPNGLRNHLSNTWICFFIFIARMSINGAFASTYVYTPEVYATSVRTTGLGFFSSCGRLAGIITSATAESLCVVVVCIVYAFAAAVGALLAYTLPRESGSGGAMFEEETDPAMAGSA